MRLTVDGFQLKYPYTGLAVVAREFLQTWCEQGHGPNIRVLVPSDFDEATLRAHGLDCTFERVEFADRWGYSLGRVVWGIKAGSWLRRHADGAVHFIPYFQNYGQRRKNTVIVPDLHWRIAPDADARDELFKWWSVKGAWRPLVHRFEEYGVSQARRIIVHSAFVEAQTREFLGVDARKIVRIPPGPPRWVKQSYDAARDARLVNDLRLPARFAMYMGRYEPRKNVGMLLRACGEVFRQETSFRCIFVGLSDPATLARHEIREAMSDPAVRASAVDLRSVDTPTLASLLRRAEFTVYPSLSEGFGLPILEAASAGRLCLCGDNSSLQELQSNPRLRIPTTDAAAWVERLLVYWRDTELTRREGDAAAALLDGYSWSRSASELWRLMETSAIRT